MIKISTSNRVFITGASGSGKSFFARYALAPAKRLVVIDPSSYIESEYDLWKFTDYGEDALEKLKKNTKVNDKTKPIRIYIPAPLNDVEWEKLFWKIYQLRNVIVYIDELYGVGPARTSIGLRALYTRGRARHIGMWGVSQRPRMIPVYCISEANFRIVFRLDIFDDRKYIAQMTNEYARKQLQDREFLITTKNKTFHFRKGLKVVKKTAA